MNKRKRVEDHDARPRSSPLDQTITRVRRSLAELGEPSRNKVDIVLRDVAEMLVGAHDDVRAPALQMMRAVVYEQPHKIPLLALLIEIVAHQKPTTAQMAVEMAHTEIVEALKKGLYRRVDLFLRFAAALTIVSGGAFDELLTDLADRAVQSPGIIGQHLFNAVVYASLYRKHAGYEVPERVNEAIAEFVPQTDNTDALFYGEDAPYVAKPYILLVKEAALTSSQQGWPSEFLLQADQLLPGREPVAAEIQHRFPAVEVPSVDELAPLAPDAHAPLSTPLYTQIYLPATYETVPPPSDLFALLLRDVASANICHMDFNRKEVTRQLITLDLFFNPKVFAPPGHPFDALGEIEGSRWKVEDVAVEAVLDKMLMLPATEFPHVYYDTILIEACVMAPQAIAPVLGRALRFLFANAESLDAELLFRITDWFAHHVSNFGFTWKWNEWLDALQLPRLHPKQVFMRELLAKQVRLSYPQRVKDVLPAEIVPLVPEIPEVPDYIYSDDEAAKQLIEGLKSTPDAAQAAFHALKEKVTQAHIGHDADAADREVAGVLVTTVCDLGNRSVSHADTWITRAAPLLRDGVLLEQWIVDAVFQYWHASPWVASLVIDRFIVHGIVSPTTVVQYVLAHRDLLISSLGFEILGKHTKGLDEALDKLKSDGDEWDEWWVSRLKKSLKRREAAQQAKQAAQQAVKHAEQEAKFAENERLRQQEREAELAREKAAREREEADQRKLAEEREATAADKHSRDVAEQERITQQRHVAQEEHAQLEGEHVREEKLAAAFGTTAETAADIDDVEGKQRDPARAEHEPERAIQHRELEKEQKAEEKSVENQPAEGVLDIEEALHEMGA